MQWFGIVHTLIESTFGGATTHNVRTHSSLLGARIGYVNNGRSGQVVFGKGGKSFAMYYEFGGGDTVAIIDIPTVGEWESRTAFSLDMRQPILEFIGATVVKDQVSMSKGWYQIDDDCIRIMSGATSGRSG